MHHMSYMQSQEVTDNNENLQNEHVKHLLVCIHTCQQPHRYAKQRLLIAVNRVIVQLTIADRVCKSKFGLKHLLVKCMEGNRRTFAQTGAAGQSTRNCICLQGTKRQSTLKQDKKRDSHLHIKSILAYLETISTYTYLHLHVYTVPLLV